MQKRKALKWSAALLAALLPAALLCGCTSRSLGERAIVKMIYLDEAKGKIQAGLVVFTCAPNSDTASVEGEAKIYTAEGESIEEALYNAEQEQNKKVFYAQNELLLLGPDAVQNATHFLSHFARENAARPNLAAFATSMTVDGLRECEDVISNIVREGERLISTGAEGENRTQSVFELELAGEDGMNGYLPVFEFSKEEKEFCGVRQLILMRDGKPDGMLSETSMQLALLLAGKTGRLCVNTRIEDQSVSFRTQHLQVARTASVQGGVPCLSVRITGVLDEITVNGVPVDRERQGEAANAVNGYLTQLAEELDSVTFRRGNDLFRHAWWMSQRDAASVQALEQTGLLGQTAQICFYCAIEPA